MVLPLLQDGSCSIKGRCLTDAAGVAPDCPQLDKCGSCVMWSPRDHARSGRNEGVCLLDRDARRTLDCNAAACPYYRPRRDSPAVATWRKPMSAQGTRAARPAGSARRVLGREAPAPSPGAVAMKALEGAPGALLGELALEATLGSRALPPLLERFRGGTAELRRADGSVATVPVERWYAWVCNVKAALDGLEKAVQAAGLSADDTEKMHKDVRGMRGTMTTFNLLFRDKEDHFVGQKGS